MALEPSCDESSGWEKFNCNYPLPEFANSHWMKLTIFHAFLFFFDFWLFLRGLLTGVESTISLDAFLAEKSSKKEREWWCFAASPSFLIPPKISFVRDLACFGSNRGKIVSPEKKPKRNSFVDVYVAFHSEIEIYVRSHSSRSHASSSAMPSFEAGLAMKWKISYLLI